MRKEGDKSLGAINLSVTEANKLRLHKEQREMKSSSYELKTVHINVLKHPLLSRRNIRM